MKQQPKFKVGDKVIMRKKTLYGETEGIVSEGPIRCYKALCPYTGRIDPNGLVTEERTIKSISLPYEFDGEVLKVHFPESDMGSIIMKAYTLISVFYGYSYTVKTPKMLTGYSESSLKPKSNGKDKKQNH